MTDEKEKFTVIFDLLMPGAQKKTQYPITVEVEKGNRVAALDAAEEEWKRITGQYDVRVGKPAKEG